jgi:cytochrome b6-f complex iron-sulfur subunit
LTRRQILWGALVAAGGAVGVALLAVGPKLVSLLTRPVPPKQIVEPGLMWSIGRVSDFGVGVHTQFLRERRICVVRNSERLYVIHARCTHMGCTPDWVAQENKFKCPCHGSGFCVGSAFDGDGMNCEGPAPRPLDRAHVELDPTGEVLVDVGRLYQWPKGGRSQFDEPGAYVPIRKG